MIGRNIPQVLAVAIFLGALTSPASAEQDNQRLSPTRLSIVMQSKSPLSAIRFITLAN